MIRQILLILLLVVGSGCSALLPPQINIIDSPYPDEQVVEAVSDFHLEWMLRYEEDVWWNLNGSTYGFYEMTWEDWTTPGNTAAFTVSPTYCEVGYPPGLPIHCTAIWHEMIHMTLWATRNDPDYDHADGNGPWTEDHNLMISDLRIQWKEKYPGE